MKLFPNPVHKHRNPCFHIDVFWGFIVCYIVCQSGSVKSVLKNVKFTLHMIAVTGIGVCQCVMRIDNLILGCLPDESGRSIGSYSAGGIQFSGFF